MKFQGMTFGVPKEVMPEERRVAATPDTVRKMVGEGARVLIETSAGEGAFFADEAYRDAGAEVIADVEQIFAQSDLILKVKELAFDTARNKHEIDMMHEGQYVIAFLHPASPSNHHAIKKLAAKGVVAFTLDGIPRITRAQSMDALTSMSTVAGYKAVLMAANRMPKFLPMVGTAVGVIRPANALVVGMGVAGLQAAATAKRLGAVVYGADIRPDACEQAKSLGVKVVDTGVPQELAVAEGGYAKRLPQEWLLKEQEALKATVAQADLIILTALIPGKVAPILITKEMVDSMAPGSFIADVAIDQGGNCEITEPGTVIERGGVAIEGIQNIPGMMPTSSTWLFSQNIYNYIANLVHDGRIELDMNDEIIASSLVTRDGQIVHAGAIEAMGSE